MNHSSKHDLSMNWTLPKIRKFIKALMDITLCTDIKDLKDLVLHKYIWDKMENVIGIQSNTLKKFWFNRLHLQLFCVEPIYINDIKIKLIRYLHKEGTDNKRSISWPKVCLYFDGFTSQFLYILFTNLVKTAKLRTQCENFPDQIKYLYNEYIPFLTKNSENQILPRLSYKEDNLVHIDTDLKLHKKKNFS